MGDAPPAAPIETYAPVQPRLVVDLLRVEAALPFESRLLGAGRIAVRARVLPGGHVVPVALHDRTLEQDCEPTRMDDGKLRCTPRLETFCRETKLGPAFTRSALVDTQHEQKSCRGGLVWLRGRPAAVAGAFA